MLDFFFPQPKWAKRLEGKVEKLMSVFADLATAQAASAAEVSIVRADIEKLLAAIAALEAQIATAPPAGLTSSQQGALDAAVALANSMTANLTAADVEVNPPAPAPVSVAPPAPAPVVTPTP